MLRFPQARNVPRFVSHGFEEEKTFVEARVNGGMVTTIDSSDLENNQFSDLKNVYVRNDKTSRRYGNVIFSPAKPDSNKVLALVPYERFSGDVNLIRFTPSSVHFGTTTTWTPIVGVLSGGTNDRFHTVTMNDRLFFTNNGADAIQEVDTAAFTHAALGNAPQYRFITGFNNRLLAANLGGVSPNPTQVGWSGDLNFAEWNPAVDFSAGSSPIVESPSDYADIITGIFGFSDTALLLRTHSLWGITKQPVATSPFAFNVIAPTIGCDCPFSAVAIPNGVCWFDLRTGTVYAFTVGMSEPAAIGRPVDVSIVSQVDNIETIFASYNTIFDEYTLCIPSETSTLVKCWTFNFRTKAWWYEEINNVSMLSNVDYSTSTLAIDDLIGTIDALTGTIDALSNDIATASRFYGETDGDILVQAISADDDNGTDFTAQIVSKVFQIPRNNQYITAVRLEYIPRLAGEFLVEYSKDGGETWNTYKTVTFGLDDVGLRKLVVCRKHTKARQFMWRLTSTSGLFDIIEYEVFSVPSSSESRS